MNYVEYKIGKSRLIIIEGDITKQVTYAIVNAADKELSVGGGVSGPIKYMKREPIVNANPCHKIILSLFLLKIWSRLFVAFLSIMFFSEGFTPRASAGRPSVMRFIHRI